MIKIQIQIQMQSFFNEIYIFWNKNEKYHIPIILEDKEYIDNIIYRLFFSKEDKYNYKLISINEKIGYIIYLDQFFRNMSRINSTYYNESLILNNRLIAYNYIIKENILKNYDLSPQDYVYLLMPFKHLNKYKEIFKIIYSDKTKLKYLFDNKYFNQFYSDTYFKYIKLNFKIKTPSNNYIEDNINVCDYYSKDVIIPEIYNKKILKLIKIIVSNCEINKLDNNLIIVSLSGGVDSMVITFILNLLKIKYNIKLFCIHIIYGNRKESYDEFNIIKNYTKKLKIPLFYYNIKYFQREFIDRGKYEKITQYIRFKAYKCFNESKYKPKIIMGHIKDDLIENIWSNFATGKNLFNLNGMSIYSKIDNVNIYRPFLFVNKEDIYDISKEYKISYLCNTTPSWSNRGKFRSKLYPTLKEHFKLEDDKTIEIANELSQLFIICKENIYKPIIKKFKEVKYLEITDPKLITLTGWKYLLSKSLKILNHDLIKISLNHDAIKNFMFKINYLEEKKMKYMKVFISKYIFCEINRINITEKININIIYDL